MDKVAVLASGGLDSCALVADLAQSTLVHPIYIEQGFVWENEERRALNKFVNSLGNTNIQNTTELSVPVKTLYGDHWSLTGVGVPDETTTDGAVYLPGRNVLLIATAAIWCAIHRVNIIAIGSLDGNPFPDATPEFFADFGRLLATSLSHRIEIITPYRELHKVDVVSNHEGLQLELTLSCLEPRGGHHCGACNKCGERQRAFAQSGVNDKTLYVS